MDGHADSPPLIKYASLVMKETLFYGSRSIIVATPCPPPTQAVAKP
jgi:hypothetical protein